ncbi:hypothetical protein [uncultured Bilophila sp.]|nr:hypothetical protein [uncultured Bilophila sp.]
MRLGHQVLLALLWAPYSRKHGAGGQSGTSSLSGAVGWRRWPVTAGG